MVQDSTILYRLNHLNENNGLIVERFKIDCKNNE